MRVPHVIKRYWLDVVVLVVAALFLALLFGCSGSPTAPSKPILVNTGVGKILVYPNGCGELDTAQIESAWVHWRGHRFVVESGLDTLPAGDLAGECFTVLTDRHGQYDQRRNLISLHEGSVYYWKHELDHWGAFQAGFSYWRCVGHGINLLGEGTCAL